MYIQQNGHCSFHTIRTLKYYVHVANFDIYTCINYFYGVLNIIGNFVLQNFLIIHLYVKPNITVILHCRRLKITVLDILYTHSANFHTLRLSKKKRKNVLKLYTVH